MLHEWDLEMTAYLGAGILFSGSLPAGPLSMLREGPFARQASRPPSGLSSRISSLTAP